MSVEPDRIIPPAETPDSGSSSRSSNPPGCLSAFVFAAVFCVVGFFALIWAATAMEAISALSGAPFALDLGRALLYGFGLLLPFGLVAVVLRHQDYGLWRGVALALAATGGYALLAGLLLTVDRALAWPGIPTWVYPLIGMLYAGGIIIALRKHFAGLPSLWVLGFSLTLGVVVSAAWPVAGALGTLGETVAALAEAIGLAFVSAVLIRLMFAFDNDYPTRQPFWVVWLVGGFFVAITFLLWAVRGWTLQASVVGTTFMPFALVVGSLLIFEEDAQPARSWWAAFVFFLPAYFLPLAFTEGLEGDWMPELATAWQPGLWWAMVVGTVVALGLMAIRALVSRGQDDPISIDDETGTSWMVWGFGATLAIAVIGTIAAYLLLGQPGVQPDSFLVVMADQADTSSARDIPDRDERVTSVYETLTEHADDTQADLRTFLDERGAEYTSYYLVNGIEVIGPPWLRWQIARRADVDRILESPQARPLGDLGLETETTDLLGSVDRETFGEFAEGIDYVDAEVVWDDLAIRGEGIIVGQADSGVDWQHPDLQDGYLGAADDHDYTWFDPWFSTTEPTDTGGHGTHTLGTVLGNDGIGMAPDASWIACRNLARNLGNPGFYLDCMQFLFAPFPIGGDSFDGDPLRGAHVTNNSWGCPSQEGCDGVTLAIAIEHLYNAGQMFVASAGNEGPSCGTVSPPASAQYSFAVGAMDPNTGLIVGFSSRGPVEGDDTVKPDIVAPGDYSGASGFSSGIPSSMPGGGYQRLPGTSMAGPHVAGLVALLWSADPSLIGDIDATVDIITATADTAGGEDVCGGDANDNNLYGFGIIDADEAVEQALGGSE